MKTISQKDLNKLVKERGWQLTPDSKKAMREQNTASTLSKQVEAIGDLTKSMDGIENALLENTGKDYTEFLGKLIESIRGIQAQLTEVVRQETVSDGWKFIVKRNPDGLIAEIVAEKI